MSKYLSEKQCFNRLEKYFKSEFTEKELNDSEFFPDLEGDLEWAWKFDLYGVRHLITIDRFDGKITHEKY